MITIEGRKLVIPKVDAIVGWQGDNLVEIRTFELNRLYNDIDLSLLEFKLDIQNGTNKNIVSLAKEITDDKIVLTWTILEAHLVNSGLTQIQVRGFNGTSEKWHSNIEYITIKQSINASEAFPDPLPSEFTEMELRITEAKNIAVEQAEIATTKAGEAFESATKAKQSETNVSETETTALLAIGTEKDNVLSAIEAEGDTQVARVQAVLENIVVVGGTAPDFGIWLEEV